MTPYEQMLWAQDRAGYGFLETVKLGESDRAEQLLGAIEERVLALRRVEDQIRRRSHAHRCTCPCACRERVECFLLPHRNEDGPYCPDEALTFICPACASAELCEHCGAHPRPGETLVQHDEGLMCETCLAIEREQEEDAAALLGSESRHGRLRSGLDVPEVTTHVLALRPGMRAGYAGCLRCGRSIQLADIGEPCSADLAERSGSDLRPAPRYI